MLKTFLHLSMIAATVLLSAGGISFASPLRKLEGNFPQVVTPLDDGRVVLFPQAAEFYGDEIRINPDNFCIAWWSKATDFVAWQIELSKPAEYEVWLEWAIADDQAGNSFTVAVGDDKLAGQIGKTGGWTSFQRASVGTVKLPAGKSRLEIRATAQLKGELADVRSVTLNPVGKTPPPGAPEVPTKSPAESLNSIRVHSAMQVELVAMEPLIRDPIAIAWGADLKLWVVEMGDYPLGLGGEGAPGGRIKFLEDTDADGRYDKATLFLDELAFPTGVLPWRSGVLVTCAPDIFYAEDTDGDGRADRRTPLITGFPQRNQQHRVNGLRWGLDNWVHCANGDGGVGGDTTITCIKTGERIVLGSRDLRFRPDTGEVEPQSGPSQFGRNRDDWGNWFGTNNAQPLYHFVLDEHYLARNPRLSPPDARKYLVRGDMLVYRRAPAIAFRGEQQSLTAELKPTGMGGACSGMIYRDNLLGEEFAGNAFVCDPVTNLVHRELLAPEGVSFTARRAVEEAKNEFFASADPWTRPTMVQAGPDGALYVVDMVRLYIEHPEWISDSVKQRADLRVGSSLGRIYRVYPRNSRPRVVRRLDKLTTPELVAAIDSPSGWQRDIVQQQLITRGDRAAGVLLTKTLSEAARAETRLQALATLDGLNAATDKVLLAALRDQHSSVRRLAVRLAEPRLDDIPALAEAVVALADDTDAQIVMQVAYTLGKWNDPQAGALLGQLIAKHRDNPYLVAAALSSAATDRGSLLDAVMSAEPLPDEALVSRVVGACAAPDDKLFEAVILKEVLAARGPAELRRRFTLLASLLDTALADAARRRVVDQAAALIHEARVLAAAEAEPPEVRAAAVRVLARQAEHRDDDIRLLTGFVSPTVPLTLAEAAVDRLAQTADASTGPMLARRLAELSPALRRRVFDTILVRNEWTMALLDELDRDKSLAASIDAARQQRLLTHAAADARTRAQRIFGAVEHADRKAIVAEYAAAASKPGDMERGRAVFTKHCAACHQLEGAGNEVGPSLVSLKNKMPQVLLEAVLDPSRAVEDKFIAYNATTVDGRVYAGLVQSESAISITLTAADGQSQPILRSDLESLKSTGRSLMPDGFEKTISPGAMSDLLTYLAHATAVASSPTSPSVAPEVVVPDASGTIRLLARHAKLHGTKVGINHDADCIAWMIEGERAEWILKLPAAGQYDVQIEWAQVDELAGNAFTVEAGSDGIRGTFPSTHGWANYETRVVGQLSLPSGSTRLTLAPHGRVKTELADVRSIILIPTAKEE